MCACMPRQLITPLRPVSKRMAFLHCMIRYMCLPMGLTAIERHLRSPSVTACIDALETSASPGALTEVAGLLSDGDWWMTLGWLERLLGGHGSP